MPLSLAPPTAICVIADQTVCLDVRTDRYFCLKGAANDALCTLVVGKRLTDAQYALIEKLEARNVIHSVAHCGVPAIQPVTQSVLDDLSIEPRMAIYVGLLRAFYETRRSLRRGLEAALLRAARLRYLHGSRPIDLTDVRRVANAYVWAGPFMHGHDDCLLRSIAMHAQLARRGQPAKLVLGVALHPFRAHCWVQSGNMVLNDSVETVQAFTPILVQ